MIENNVAKILSILLGQEISVGDDVSMQNQELWDSMKHIEIITTLEEELGVSFNIEDIPKLTSMQKIVEAIKDMEK
jgi:acyl carrier protein